MVDAWVYSGRSLHGVCGGEGVGLVLGASLGFSGSVGCLSRRRRLSFRIRSPAPQGNAALLVQLAAIFNLVMGGLDAIYALVHLGIAGVVFYFLTLPGAAGGGAGGGRWPSWTFSLIYVGMAALQISAGAVKITAGVKLLRLKKYPGVWGLVAGVVGCTQLWCGALCVFPLAVGIYTVVVFCLKDVKAYLRRETGEDGLPTRAFEVR